MNWNKRSLLLAMLCLPMLALAQKVLIEQRPIEEEEASDFGINRPHFMFFAMDYVVYLGNHPNESAVRNGASGSFKFGMRYKYEATKWLALGMDAAYRRDWFLFQKDEPERVFPDAIYDDQSLRFNFGSFGLYTRINFKPNRGNYAGVYLDLFADAMRPFRVSERSRYDAVLTDEEITLIRRKLDYINPVAWQIGARFGIGQIALTASYRLTPLLDENVVPNAGLPPLLFGLSFGLY